nr:AraC family transcriptional regulator [Rhizobium leguminosarum]
MASIMRSQTLRDGQFQTRIEGLFLGRCSSPTQPVHTTQWPCFALVIQGEKTLTLGREMYRYGVGDYLLVSVDLPVASRVTMASEDRPHLGLGLAINPENLRDVLKRLKGLKPEPANVGSRGVAVVSAPDALLDACLRMLRLLECPEDVDGIAPLIEQEILYYILKGPMGPRLLQVMMIESPSHSIARATAWLRENFRQPLSVPQLAAKVGMCASTFHHQFKATTNVSPLQFQKQLRLHEARRLMLMEHCDAASAGYIVGYESPSQFSREYSRLYGLSPIRDIKSVSKDGAKVSARRSSEEMAQSDAFA